MACTLASLQRHTDQEAGLPDHASPLEPESPSAQPAAGPLGALPSKEGVGLCMARPRCCPPTPQRQTSAHPIHASPYVLQDRSLRQGVIATYDIVTEEIIGVRFSLDVPGHQISKEFLFSP